MDLEGEEAEEIRALMAELNRRQGPIGAAAKRGEIFPSDPAAVLTAAGPRVMRWGFSRPSGAALVVNARSETADEKPMFRAALRCLVPAAHYFEWAHRGADRIKYRIGAESGPLYMAGLYRAEDGTPSFVVLTRAADARIAFIHGRMPLILSSGARAAWLRGAPLEKARREAVPQLFFVREDGQTSLFPD